MTQIEDTHTFQRFAHPNLRQLLVRGVTCTSSRFIVPAASHTSSRAVEKIAVLLSNPLFRRRAGVTRRLGRRTTDGLRCAPPALQRYGYPVRLFGGQVRSWL